MGWILAQKPWIVPIPGTKKLHRLEENLGAIDITFTNNELKEFCTAFEKFELIGVCTPETINEDR